MPSFRKEWGQLLVNPLSWVGGMTTVVRILGSGIAVSCATAVAGLFGNVPWWVVPLVAFAVFYLSLTAGMAWERARGPSVKVSPLLWDEGAKVFYVLADRGPGGGTIRFVTRLQKLTLDIDPVTCPAANFKLLSTIPFTVPGGDGQRLAVFRSTQLRGHLRKRFAA